MNTDINLAPRIALGSASSNSCHKLLGGLAFSLLTLSATVADAAPMQVSGRQLKDSCGNAFVVRGVEQILGEQLPEGNDWVGLIEQIVASGANSVRILPSVNTLSLADVDDMLTLVGESNMVAFIDPLNGDDWYARADVKAMLAKHESYLIIDAYGEPQFDDRARFVQEAKEGIRRVRALGYRVPLTVTANQYGRDLPSILQFGQEILAADPLHNTFLGWQAYWGQGGYYQGHYGMSLTQAVDAIVRSGLPIQFGLDHITDPGQEADFGLLMAAAKVNNIGWLWWDWYNPYGTDNNLSRDGSVDALTPTGNAVVNTHLGSLGNTSRLACSEVAAPPPPPPPAPPAPPPPPPLPAAVISINAGGSASGGFVADRSFAGGSAASATASIDRSRIAAPAPAESVYKSERWGNSTYRVGGLTRGTSYKVQLHFAEVYFNSAGKRKFHVNINAQRVLTDFDVFARAGAKNRAIQENFSAVADGNGEIVIRFRASLDQPKISAIVVTR